MVYHLENMHANKSNVFFIFNFFFSFWVENSVRLCSKGYAKKPNWKNQKKGKPNFQFEKSVVFKVLFLGHFFISKSTITVPYKF